MQSTLALPPSQAPVGGNNTTTVNATIQSLPTVTLPPPDAASDVLGPSVEAAPQVVTEASVDAVRVEVPMAEAGGYTHVIGLLLAAAAFGLPSKYALNFLPLFSRHSHDEMLRHEVRRKIVTYVDSHPGIHYSALRRALGLPNGTLSFHIRSLERTGYLRSKRVGVRLHFFAGPMPTDLRPEDTLIPPRGDLLDYIRLHPGTTQRETCRALNMLPSRVNYHIRALTQIGLIEVRREGRTTRCYASALGDSAEELQRPTALDQ